MCKFTRRTDFCLASSFRHCSTSGATNTEGQSSIVCVLCWKLSKQLAQLSDQLEGGFDKEDALKVVEALDRSSVDLIDISGGTYFPGAKSASDGTGRGPYFLEFAGRARAVTTKPLMLTGGFKTRAQAEDAVASGEVDIVGLARAFVLEPSLPDLWKADRKAEPSFPRFSDAPEGGITVWYTMRLRSALTKKRRFSATSGRQSETMKRATNLEQKFGCVTLPMMSWDKSRPRRR